MTTYYIITPALYTATDWQASPHTHVGPVPIYSGPYAGSYAVNTDLLGSDPSFESYRSLLEAQPTATLTLANLTNTQESN